MVENVSLSKLEVKSTPKRLSLNPQDVDVKPFSTGKENPIKHNSPEMIINKQQELASDKSMLQ
jgi:hypothetical protein